MNKFQKASLAVIAASGMAFAGGSLWQVSEDFPSLQVRTDNVVDCWAANPPDEDYQSPCYEKAGGWWFGYVNHDDGSQPEKVEVKLNGDFVNFGPGTALADKDDGSFFIENALEVKATTMDASDDPGAGIGFNHKQENAGDRWDGSATNTVNISSKGGYCITYTLTGDAMEFVLGWDESGSGNARWDAWYAPIQPASSKTVLDLTWSKFKQDAWSKPNNFPISKAQNEAVSVKIRYNGKDKEGTFSLYQLGWAGECDTKGPSKVANVGKANGIAMSLAGRSLSLSGFGKTANVQILNLHGAIVANQTLDPSGKINLGNLPTGVYMVRVPSMGYVNKIMLK